MIHLIAHYKVLL